MENFENLNYQKTQRVINCYTSNLQMEINQKLCYNKIQLGCKCSYQKIDDLNIIYTFSIYIISNTSFDCENYGIEENVYNFIDYKKIQKECDNIISLLLGEESIYIRYFNNDTTNNNQNKLNESKLNLYNFGIHFDGDNILYGLIINSTDE